MGWVPCVPSPCGAGGSAWGHGGAGAPRCGMWSLEEGCGTWTWDMGQGHGTWDRDMGCVTCIWDVVQGHGTRDLDMGPPLPKPPPPLWEQKHHRDPNSAGFPSPPCPQARGWHQAPPTQIGSAPSGGHSPPPQAPTAAPCLPGKGSSPSPCAEEETSAAS